MTMQILEQPKQLTKKFSDILRNTKFKQCYGQEAGIWIKNGEPEMEARCAIGVLMTEYFGYDYFKSKHDGNKTTLSLELQDMLLSHNIHAGQIIELNDSRKLSFSEIADFLESKGL
jgi:hypothetical protein